MEYLCHKRTHICSTCRKHLTLLSSFMTYHRRCNQINTTSPTSGAGPAYPSGAPEICTPDFQWGSCYSIFSFMCMFCRSLFVLLSFFFWPLCCLSFDLRILITPLVSSNSFYHFFLFDEFPTPCTPKKPRCSFFESYFMLNMKRLLSIDDKKVILIKDHFDVQILDLHCVFPCMKKKS